MPLSLDPNSGIPAGLRKRAFDDVSGVKGHAAGVLYVAPDGDVLLCRRSPGEENYGGWWSLPGGGAEDGETPEEAAKREVGEELGRHGVFGLRLLDRRVTPTGKAFHTFVKTTEEKFQPTLNGEHVGYAWFPLDGLPEKTHPAVRRTLDERLGIGAADMTPEDWNGLREGFLKWTAEEEAEGEHALDDADPLDWGADLDDLPVDSSHDGPWMSVMARDGSRMYRNKNLPGSAEIAGKTVDVDDMLKAHEAPEWVEIKALLAAFEKEHGREPDEKERVALYNEAHRKKGVPGERAHAKAQGVDWGAWNAWCRGEEEKLEKGPFTNEPTDADVRPIPHDHGELEVTTDSALVIALDRESVRQLDQDGRLRVAITAISKANICPYRGGEIPRWRDLGLDQNKIYNLLRDPDELAKAAPTFNGIQLLRIHKPVNATAPQVEEVVGTTGTEAEFVYPYLRNSLVVWTQEGIDFIESEEKKELSSGYHYDADMTPGTFDGKQYDGVMRNLRGNHVALVEQGRAGPDVVVADSMEGLMANAKPTRLAAAALRLTARGINPLLAHDAKVELMPFFADLNTKNFKERKPKVLDGLKAALKGKTIAKDADISHVALALDEVEKVGEKDKAADESVSEPQHKAMEAAAHGHSNLGIPKSVGEEFSDADKGKKFDELPAFLKEKGMSEDDVEHVMGMFPQADKSAAGDVHHHHHYGHDESETDEEKKAREKKAEDSAMIEGGSHMHHHHAADSKGAKDKAMVTKDEMDATLKAALAANAKEIRAAEKDIRIAMDEVRPYVGDLPATLGLDSGSAVRRHALKVLQVEGADAIHESALSTILKMQPKAGAREPDPDRRRTSLGMDAATVKGFNERFPDADRIKLA